MFFGCESYLIIPCWTSFQSFPLTTRPFNRSERRSRGKHPSRKLIGSFVIKCKVFIRAVLQRLTYYLSCQWRCGIISLSKTTLPCIKTSCAIIFMSYILYQLNWKSKIKCTASHASPCFIILGRKVHFIPGFARYTAGESWKSSEKWFVSAFWVNGGNFTSNDFSNFQDVWLNCQRIWASTFCYLKTLFSFFVMALFQVFLCSVPSYVKV